MKEVSNAGRAPQDASLFNSFMKLIQKVGVYLSLPRIFPLPIDHRLWAATDVRESDECKNFLKCLRSNPKFQELSGKVIFSVSLRPVRLTEIGIVAHLLNEYMIRKRHQDKYGETIPQDLYLQWESELYETELDCYAIGFLHYTFADKAIDLGEQTTIRKLDLAERFEWQERMAISRVLGEEKTIVPWFVIEARWKEKKTVESVIPDIRALRPGVPDRVQHVIDAVRLFGAPRSHLSRVYVCTESKTHATIHEIARPYPYLDRKYTFHFDDVLSNKFIDFWISVRNALRERNESWWNNAIRRYERSILDDYSEDKLVDLIIALEGSLLADPPGELRRTLSQRLAVLNSITCTKAEIPDSRAYELAYEAYGLRNKVVHGSITEDHMENIRKSLEPLRELARASLLRLLGLLQGTCSKKREEERRRIHEILDNGIFQQEVRDEIKNRLATSFIAKFDEVLQPNWWKSLNK